MIVHDSDFVMEEKLLNRKVLYDGRVLTLAVDDVLLPSGKEAVREIVVHKKAVAILPVLDDHSVLLIRQYRHAAGEVLYEIPAGLMEEDETPYCAADRELVEETGYKAEQLELVSRFYTSPGFCDEEIHLFIARDLSEAFRPGDDDEWTAPVRISTQDAFRMMQREEIRDGKTILALCWYLTSAGLGF